MKQGLKNILNSLPPNLKKAFYSDRTSDIIKDATNLGQLNNDIDKLNIIEGDVMDVLLGRSPLNTFKETLRSNLNVPDTNLIIINKIIQDKIFEPLKNDLGQLKINRPEFTSQKIPQEIEIKEPIEYSESPKIKPVIPVIKPAIKEKVEQTITEQILSEPIIPEYSFPEPSEVKVEKPVSKIEKLKKVVAPRVSSEQQEKIREKLLAAMQKKDVQPEIVEKMKKVIFEKPVPEEKKEPLKKKSIGEVASSEVLGGEGKKFKDEEVFKKTEKEKPYIIDVKLKEEKEKKEEAPIVQEPIPYKKYQKENPFGQA